MQKSHNKLKHKYRHKIWHDNHCRRINRKRCRKAKLNNNDDDSNRSSHFKPKKFKIVAPKTLSFIRSKEETGAFFEKILSIFKSKTNKHNHSNDSIYIDLSLVNQIDIEAIMYLVAITNNIKFRLLRKIKISGNFPKNKKVQEIICNSGFLRYVDSPIYKNNNNQNNIQITQGNDINPCEATKVIEFIKNNSNCGNNTLRCLYSMIIEIMSNTVQHAYNTNNNVFINNWYMYTDVSDNKIRITILDTGEGIPTTVSRKFTDSFKQFRKKSESLLIDSALQGQFRTETKEKHRGNGLPQVLKGFEESNINKLYVISGRGSVLFDKTQGKHIFENSQSDFWGTVYYFSI